MQVCKGFLENWRCRRHKETVPIQITKPKQTHTTMNTITRSTCLSIRILLMTTKQYTMIPLGDLLYILQQEGEQQHNRLPTMMKVHQNTCRLFITQKQANILKTIRMH